MAAIESGRHSMTSIVAVNKASVSTKQSIVKVLKNDVSNRSDQSLIVNATITADHSRGTLHGKVALTARSIAVHRYISTSSYKLIQKREYECSVMIWLIAYGALASHRLRTIVFLFYL